MKIIAAVVLATSFLFGSYSYCQQPGNDSRIPKWVSEKGFWQIETNTRTPARSIVYFFDNDGTLIYKESVDGLVLNLRRKKVKMRLKKALDTAVAAWHKDSVYRNDQQLISMLFKN